MSSKAKKQPAAPATKAVGRSFEDFRSAFDRSTIVPGRIKSALAELGSNWEREIEFSKLAGVSIADLAAFRAAFEEHIVVLNREHHGKRVWVGNKNVAAKMREMLR